jgi:GTP pyrophosphokinase
MQTTDELYESLVKGYMESAHRKKVDLIQKAYNFACHAHEGATRPCGEPYMIHPLSVAIIASQEMGLGSTSICAALLHDSIQDTDYTIDDIENIFGTKIAQIVDGLTKISGGIFGAQAEAQAENLKNLLLTMSEDILVILIKICDRLDNMRHIEREE